MSLIDLHVHTTASDGLLSPEEVIHKAEAENLRAIAIADHDTVDGVQQALDSAGEIHVIPAIEFSVDFKGGTYHLLGMNIDHTCEPLVEKTRELKERRDSRTENILEDLAKHRIFITMDEVLEEAKGGAVGRPHIGRCLIKHNYGENITEIFQKFLVKGKPGYAPKEKISLDEAMSLIHQAEGTAVIAHPVSLNAEKDDFLNILKDFIELGGRGLEVYASMHSEEWVAYYKEIALRYQLLISGGSDFHGDKNEKLGFYQDDSPIPEDLYLQFI